MWVAPIVVVRLVVLGFVVMGYSQGRWTWDGTGFEGRSLWDWLDLLIVPVALGIGGIWFQRAQKRREIKSQDRQRERERQADQRQREREEALANQRAQDAALQSYLDEISALLIDAELAERLHDFEDKQGDRLRVLARARTLTALGQLDGTRKSSLMQFLYEADLICKDQPAVSLRLANLSNASLSGAYLSEANLSEANLSGANLSNTNLSEADLRNAVLTAARLSTANLGGNLSLANLSEAYVFGANLRGANLFGANLSEADLSGANLRGAKPFGADLQRANLRGVNLSGANLRGASLKRADLSGADLNEAYLSGADLGDEANLRDAKRLTQEQIDEAYGDQTTQLPDHLKRPESWSKSTNDQPSGD